ncbi:MAG TPA: class D sortase [Candidatus Merdicola faecigallinarum]|uniref:Class D sortase n=1 Tax=Candidatus Merdicola faecigallinarum TaxID=2840862 RepID=A0A9D1S9E3_9FIRM|nr:class D sortase [Candidatus Merdicola faecigallinarum]
MHKKLSKVIKATIIEIIVAFLLVVFSVIIIDVALGQKKEIAVTLINTMSLDKEEVINQAPVLEGKVIKNYPEYGSKYAKIQIPKIGVNLDVYYGDTMEILKKGVGHSSGSYFPGEGGSIVYMGHNSKKVFRRFGEIEKGDFIQINTDYGEFKYQVYDMKIVNEMDLDALPIQKEKEMLMVYTCYPFQNIGYTTQRYVVYAERIEEEEE